jgi:hypothetical protein
MRVVPGHAARRSAQYGDGVVSADPAGGSGRERFAGVFVGDGEDFDRPAVGWLVDEVVKRPDVVRAVSGEVAGHSLAPPTPTRPSWQAQPLVS